MQKLTGLLMIIIGLCVGSVGVEGATITGLIGLGIAVGGLLITWKAEK